MLLDMSVDQLGQLIIAKALSSAVRTSDHHCNGCVGKRSGGHLRASWGALGGGLCGNESGHSNSCNTPGGKEETMNGTLGRIRISLESSFVEISFPG
jgi:hypothetical protein